MDAVMILLIPQPDYVPFQIAGDMSENWYNERRAYRNNGNSSIMVIHWTPPEHGMRPVRNVLTDNRWAWEKEKL